MMPTRAHALSRLTRAALLGAALAGCGGGAPSGIATRPHAPAYALEGTWRWVSSLDVRTQAVHTPGTAGYGATIRFVPEGPHAGTFTYVRAGAAPVQGRFGISSEDAPGNDFVVLEPGIDLVKRNAWLTVGRDSLRLGGVMELGYNSTFGRVAP